MKAVVFAYHDMGIVGLEAMKRQDIQVEAIFSHRDDPGERIWFGSVGGWAERNGIPCFFPDRVNTPEWIERIKQMAPDLLFSFYYRHLLSGDILRIPRAGAYNLHGSLLPAYRGRSPVNWVLVRGEKKTGITLHHMIEKADAGDIVGQKETRIEFDDTALTLFGKLCKEAERLLDEVLPLILDGTAPRIPQDPKKASYVGGRRPEDGRIAWSWPAERIFNLIRAVTEPYPGAYSFLPEGEKILIWWAVPETGAARHGGEGAVETVGGVVHVLAADGQLRLLDVEVGGKRMKGEDIFDYFKKRKGIVLK
jgi:UDP-4-amino-4-deoxy-L-arabinose formyltransferase/UDP-glucuronic acid dehydrogenase (UDP-4-keto-hexauronic acid decarboxylating)